MFTEATIEWQRASYVSSAEATLMLHHLALQSRVRERRWLWDNHWYWPKRSRVEDVEDVEDSENKNPNEGLDDGEDQTDSL